MENIKAEEFFKCMLLLKKTDEEKAETRRLYYANNKEKIQERQRNYYHEHREQLKDKAKEYQKKRTPEQKAKKQEYNQTEKAKEMITNWQQSHKSKYCEICKKEVNRKSFAKHTRTQAHLNNATINK